MSTPPSKKLSFPVVSEPYLFHFLLVKMMYVVVVCRCKTSIFFGLPNDDKAGALSKALSYFAENKVNLIWLDSQKLYPEERQQWREDLHFLFYANFEGLVSEERVQRALTGLRNVAPFMRVMGSHKMHRKFLEDFP